MMLYEVLAVVCGGVLGFATTWKFVSAGIREEEKKEEEIRRAKISTISSAIEKKVEESKMSKPPSDLSEFVEYLSDKYILGEITILTPEGLPIVSNSSSPEEDSAVAPEIMRVARRLLNSDRVVLSGEESRILVLQVNPDVILHAKIARDISRREMDRIRDEVNMVMEGLI